MNRNFTPGDRQRVLLRSQAAPRQNPKTPKRGSDLLVLRADDGIRTRDPHLGKVMLYQLSHVRVWS